MPSARRSQARVVALAATGAMLFASQALAQGARPGVSDSVPRALAEALLATRTGMMSALGMGGAPRLVVGTLPASLAQRLWVPPGATILGGTESSGGGVAIIRSRIPADSLEGMYRREQLVRGWTVPPPRNLPLPREGFAPAPSSSTDTEEGLLFCSGSTVLVIGIETVSGVQEINAQALGMGMGLCAMQRPADPSSRFGRRYHPTLINPPGAGDGANRGCGEWNSRGGGGRTSLQTTMSLDDVMNHYARQLADSGWAPVTDQQTIVRSWTRRDTAGTMTEVTLTGRGQTPPRGCIEFEMGVNSRVPPT